MNEALLKNLACPLSHSPLEWDKANQRLISRKAAVSYPIENGIPVLLPEKAEPLDQEKSSQDKAGETE